jgi:AbrB family looped-hinge helix DNA binding protein
MEQKSKATITSKGQVTLPAAIRRALNLRAGDVITFELDQRGVHVTADKAKVRFQKYAGKFRVGRGKTAREINSWLRQIRGRDAE